MVGLPTEALAKVGGDLDKKIYLIGGLLAILLIALVIFLFSRNTQKTPTNINNKIVIWDSFESEENLTEAFNQYKAQNKGIEIEYVKKDPAKYETDSINAFAAGGGPDIWIIPNNWMPKHHDKLAILTENKLDPKAKKTNSQVYQEAYLQAAGQDNIIDNNVYGFPMFMDSLSLYDNNSLRSQKVRQYISAHPNEDSLKINQTLGIPPITWEVLSEQIKSFGENTIALGDSTTVERSSDILVALMLQYGTKMTSDDKTQALFQAPINLFTETAYPGNKALSFYTSFAKKDDSNYTWPALESAYKSFTNGNLMMMIDYSQKQAELKKDTKISFLVTSLPQFKDSQNPINLAYYQTMTVPKTSQNQDKAWNLIRYLSAGQGQNKYLSKTGFSSALKENTINSQAVLDIQNRSAQSWYNPDPGKVEVLFKNVIDQTRQGINPQTVLEGAAASVTKLLSELNP